MSHGGDRRSHAARQRQARHGNPLWEYRERHGLSQMTLGEMLFVSQEAISDMERGRTPIMPHIKAFLAKAEKPDGVSIGQEPKRVKAPAGDCITVGPERQG